MHRFSYFILIIVLVPVFLARYGVAEAQQITSPWYLGAGSGVGIPNFNQTGKATAVFRLFGGYGIVPGFALQSEFYTGRFVSSHHKNYYHRSYHTQYAGFSLEPRLNFLSMFRARPLEKYLDIYGFGGPGLLWYNAKTSIKQITPSSKPYVGIDNKSVAMVYSLGLGLKVNVTRQFSIEAGYSYHLSNSELIDGYPTIGDPTRIYRPHEYQKDSWNFLTLGFSIHLGKLKSASRQNRATVDAYGYTEQLQQMNRLIDQNIATVQKTNQELEQTTEVLGEFQKLATEIRLQRQQEKIAKLQTKLDSIGNMQSEIDSLKIMQDRIRLIRNSIKNQEAVDKSRTVQQADYYVVAGEFLTRDKAEKELAELQSGSYPKAAIIKDSNNVWFLVTYAGAQSKSDAQGLLGKVKSYDNPLAWIYTMKK